MYKIDPTIAAHNIATLMAQKYINYQVESITDADSTKPQDAAKQAANLYEIAYDAVFEQISDSNKFVD